MDKKKKPDTGRNPDGTFKKGRNPQKLQKKNKGGSPKGPRIKIDFDIVDNLCALHCTAAEIAAALDVGYNTLERRVKEETGEGLGDYIKKRSEKGKVSLRRAQWKTALTGNTTMLVWLGKQVLEQKDRTASEISGPGGLPLPSEIKISFVDPKEKKVSGEEK